MGRVSIFVFALILIVSGILSSCGGVLEHTAEWHAVEGGRLAKEGHYDQAIQECNKAIVLHPNRAETYYNRGLAYKEQGKKADAITDFEKCITLTAKDPNVIQMARQQIEELSK